MWYRYCTLALNAGGGPCGKKNAIATKEIVRVPEDGQEEKVEVGNGRRRGCHQVANDKYLRNHGCVRVIDHPRQQWQTKAKGIKIMMLSCDKDLPGALEVGEEVIAAVLERY